MEVSDQSLLRNQSEPCGKPQDVIFLPEPEEALFLALMDRGEIVMTSAQAEDDDIVLIARSSRPVAVTYDAVQQQVFWSDVRERQIYRSNLDGSDVSVLLNITQGLGFVEGETLKLPLEFHTFCFAVF